MPQDNEQELRSKLIAIIEEAVQRDEQLRQAHQIGDKFRFVRERLQALLENIKKETVVERKKTSVEQDFKVEEDETVVYVHLYNSQGMNVRTWQSMITPKAFFDYSVNRPIYQEQKYIEAFIRTKTNKMQHAYLTVAMKRERVLIHPNAEEGGWRDALGNPLTKVKEGSLRYERLVSFTHNELVYQVNEGGEFIKKPPESSTAQ